LRSLADTSLMISEGALPVPPLTHQSGVTSDVSLHVLTGCSLAKLSLFILARDAPATP